jgi:adenylosuccinate lyase
MLAILSLNKGISKLLLNQQKLHDDLENNWAVVAEAIQTILRRENYPKPYEALKELTRGKGNINKDSIHDFVDSLDLSDGVKAELKAITPHNYTGIF